MIFLDPSEISEIYDRVSKSSALRKFALFSSDHIMNGVEGNNRIISAWDMEEIQQHLLKNGVLFLDYLKLFKEHDISKPVEDPLKVINKVIINIWIFYIFFYK